MNDALLSEPAAGAEARPTTEARATEYDVRTGPEPDYAPPGQPVLDYDGITWVRGEDGGWRARLTEAQLGALPEGSVLIDDANLPRTVRCGELVRRIDADIISRFSFACASNALCFREIHVPVTQRVGEQERLLQCDLDDPPQADQDALDEMLREIGAPELCIRDEDADAGDGPLATEVPLD